MARDNEDKATIGGSFSRPVEAGRSFDMPQGPSEESRPASPGLPDQLAG
jgi:hypothetical protein